MKINKIRVYIGILILLVIIFLVVSCSTFTYSNREEPIETISVSYLVYATSDVESISVTYSNPDGGTEQKADLKPTMFKGETLQIFTVASFEEFPVDEFIYLSAQNENDSGDIIASIRVNREDWKSAESRGGYTIATVSGFYEE